MFNYYKILLISILISTTYNIILSENITLESICYFSNDSLTYNIILKNNYYENLYMPISQWQFVTYRNQPDSASTDLVGVNEVKIFDSSYTILFPKYYKRLASFGNNLPLFVSIQPQDSINLIFKVSAKKLKDIIPNHKRKMLINLNYVEGNSFNQMIHALKLKKNKIIINLKHFTLKDVEWPYNGENYYEYKDYNSTSYKTYGAMDVTNRFGKFLNKQISTVIDIIEK